MRPNDSAWQAFRVSLMSPLITGEVLQEDREASLRKASRTEPSRKLTLLGS